MSGSRKRRRWARTGCTDGVSLAEVIIGSTIFLMLMTVALNVLVPVGQTWVRSSDRATAQQNSLVPMTRIEEEFRWSDPNGIATVSHTLPGTLPDGATAHSDTLFFWSCKQPDGTGDYDATGNQVYQRRIAFFYKPEVGEVWMASCYPNGVGPQPSPSPTPDLSPATLAAWSVTSWSPQGPFDALQRLATQATSLAFSSTPDGLVTVRVDTAVNGQTATLSTTLAPLQPPTVPSPSPTP